MNLELIMIRKNRNTIELYYAILTNARTPIIISALGRKTRLSYESLTSLLQDLQIRGYIKKTVVQLNDLNARRRKKHSSETTWQMTEKARDLLKICTEWMEAGNDETM